MFSLYLLHVLRLFPALQLKQTGLQDLEGRLSVGMLRPLILTLNHNPGRQVGNAHCGIGFVDVLPSGPAGTEGIYPQILRIQVNLHLIRQFRHNHHLGKAGMAAAGGVEGRDSYQAVHPMLSL